MKFNLNINYKIEADNLDEASEIVTQLVVKRSFSFGSAIATGYNLNEQYMGGALIGAGDAAKTAEEVIAEDDADDDCPF